MIWFVDLYASDSMFVCVYIYLIYFLAFYVCLCVFVYSSFFIVFCFSLIIFVCVSLCLCIYYMCNYVFINM